MNKYATTARKGYFGDITTVYSTHKTADAAIREAKRHNYTDEQGETKSPVAAVRREHGFSKGEKVYRDSYPDYAKPTPTAG